MGSDLYGTATSSGYTSTTFTLTLPVATWPLWAQLYTVSFDQDGYTKQYPLLASTSTVLVVSDPSLTGPVSQSNVKWQISGTPYDQTFNLTSYNITWAPLSDEQNAFQGPSSPGGGGNLS